jgi:hypothetical protein
MGSGGAELRRRCFFYLVLYKRDNYVDKALRDDFFIFHVVQSLLSL